MVDLSVKLGDITLANPVMPASGTFNYDVGDVIDINRLGAMVAKTVSRDFRAGNPTPRMAETEAGIIQSIGLPGNGIKYFLDTMVPEYKKYTPPLVASISAETPEDFAAMARDISVPEVDIIEVNISCPTRDPSGGNFSLQTSHTRNVIKGIRAETDKPIAGLLKDLKQRGMLKNTLIVWGGEFGRQPTAEYSKGTGRDHNSYGFTMWMAGGGIKGGVSVGTTDELGSKAVEDRFHVKNLHATVLNQLGFDPNRLSYFYDGLEQRLVGVEGAEPIKQVIA